MLRYTLALVLCIASFTMACEPLCRRGVAKEFAEHYRPVVQHSVDELYDVMVTDLSNVTIPEVISSVVPLDSFWHNINGGISNALKAFVEQASEKQFEPGIFSVMFQEENPFKGDCNAPPRRLTRNMPPPGESWTREECNKMDYICGNPPSICHFLPEVKNRIVKRLQKLLIEDATFDNGILVRGIIQSIKHTTRSILTYYGAGSLLDDPAVTDLTNIMVSHAIRSLDQWAAVDVRYLCQDPSQDELCNGWDEDIIPKILQWP